MPDDAAVRNLLRSASAWIALAACHHLSSGNMGAGSQRNVLCCHVHPHTESRADAATAAITSLDSSGWEHGPGHRAGAQRRGFSLAAHQVFGGILCGIHDSLLSPVRHGAKRRMKSTFIFFAGLTFVLLVYGTYQGVVVAPREETMGEAQRIFYYHVPAATAAYTLFLINFVASLLYLWKRSPVADAWAIASAEVGV